MPGSGSSEDVLSRPCVTPSEKQRSHVSAAQVQDVYRTQLAGKLVPITGRDYCEGNEASAERGIRERPPRRRGQAKSTTGCRFAPGLGAEVGGVRCPRAQLPGGGPSQILPRGEPRQIVLGRRRATVSVDELAGRFRMLAEDEVTRRTLQPGNHFCRKR